MPKVEQHLFRFGIQDISEFYGSTEGNSNIINFDNTVGAVGFVPVLFAGILPLGPIKVQIQAAKNPINVEINIYCSGDGGGRGCEGS